MNKKKYFKKIISLSIVCFLVSAPVVDFAQTVDTTNAPRAIPVNENPYGPNNPSLTPEFVNSQIQGSVNSTANTNSATTQAATGAASCMGSQLISQSISSAISGALSGSLSAVTDNLSNIPVAESGSVKANIVANTSAGVGTVGSLGGMGTILSPAWDAIGYCIVNSMIVYIANSTLEWINTGFEGNPAFLTNPDQFFTDLANAEKRAFIQNLAYGVNSGVCGAFKGTIVSSILSRYGRNQQNYYNQQGYENGGYGQGLQGQNGFNGCAFDQNPGQLNAFLGGNFTEGGGWNSWFQLTQNPNNNPYDTYFRTNERLNTQVAAVKLSKTTELNWNNGYLSYRKCENGEKDVSKCPVTTPGTVIQKKLETTLDLGTDRLLLADKFNQVVTALVDQLITTALDKTFETVNSN